MKQGIDTVVENLPLTRDVWQMRLAGDTSAFTAPGQFAALRLEGFFLRRPISICDWDGNGMTLLYKVVGHGTDAMTRLEPGAAVDILTGLGHGYDLAPSGPSPLLVGGGVGVPPLYGLCRRLLAQGKAPRVLLGFNTASEVFYADAFQALGVPVQVSTVDGSHGTTGFVSDLMQGLSYDYFYACGPMPMFRAIEAVAATSGQYSLEERMGCGFGACMGCTIKTRLGPKRVCKDGPVFHREEVLF